MLLSLRRACGAAREIIRSSARFLRPCDNPLVETASTFDPHYADWHRIPLPALNDEQLKAIIRRHGVAGEHVELIRSAGVINSVYLIDGRYVLRVPRRIGEGIRATYTESVVLPIVNRIGIRCPGLVAFDDALDIVDVPFTIQEFIDGAPLTESSQDARARVFRQLGTELALLHGHLDEITAPSCRPEFTSLFAREVPLFIRVGRGDRIRSGDASRLLRDLRDSGNITAQQGSWFERTLSRLENLFEQATLYPSLLHRDITSDNIIVKEQRLAALLDWGNAGRGDPVIDFRRIPPAFILDTVGGYREARALDGEDNAAERILWDRVTIAIFNLWESSPERANHEIALLEELERVLDAIR